MDVARAVGAGMVVAYTEADENYSGGARCDLKTISTLSSRT